MIPSRSALLSSVRVRVLTAVLACLALVTVTLAFLVGSDGGRAAAGETPQEAFATLTQRVSGEDAVTELGGDDGEAMESVARGHGMKAGDLAELLRDDETLHVDESGRLYFADGFGGHDGHGHGDVDLPEPTVGRDAGPDAGPDGGPDVQGYSTSGATTQTGSSKQVAPLEDTFRLHSVTSTQASPTIFLDFDGHTFASGDNWGLAGQRAAAWDPGRNGPAFSDDELLRIQQIWARVAQHYSFQAIDVTTEEPLASRFTAGSQPVLRVLVSPSLHYDAATNVVSNDPSAPPQPQNGTIGLARLGTAVGNFGPAARLTPALIFAARMEQHDDASFAWVISHEAGHNLNLQHVFAESNYQSTRVMGADNSSLHGLIMDYGRVRPMMSFTRQERELNALNTLVSDRWLRAFWPWDTTAAPVDGRRTFHFGAPFVTQEQRTLSLTGCENLHVRATSEGIVSSLDVGISLRLDGTEVARDAPNTTVGTQDRNAGTGAEIVFTADPSKTYELELFQSASDDSATPAYPADYTYGRVDLSVLGCGESPAPPNVPSDVRATLETAEGVPTGASVVTWSAPTHPGSTEVSYEIAVDGQRVTTVPAGTLSHRIATIPEQGARFRVRAVNSAGASDWVESTTPATAAPLAPVHVSVVHTGTSTSDGIPLARMTVVHDRGFQPSDDDATAWLFAVRPSDGASIAYQLSSATTDIYLDARDFPLGSRLAYSIRHPGHTQVNTWYTVRAEPVAPTAPRTLRATANGTDVDVSWVRPSDDGSAFASYEVRLDGGTWQPVDGFTFAHTFSDVSSGAHAVEVRARHHAGTSDAVSTTVTVAGPATLAASAPRGVEIVEDATSTRLVWRTPARLYGADVVRWQVTVGGRTTTVAPTRRSMVLTGFRTDRTLQVDVAAVTSLAGGAPVVGQTATVRLAPAD